MYCTIGISKSKVTGLRYCTRTNNVDAASLHDRVQYITSIKNKIRYPSNPLLDSRSNPTPKCMASASIPLGSIDNNSSLHQDSTSGNVSFRKFFENLTHCS